VVCCSTTSADFGKCKSNNDTGCFRFSAKSRVIQSVVAEKTPIPIKPAPEPIASPPTDGKALLYNAVKIWEFEAQTLFEQALKDGVEYNTIKNTSKKLNALLRKLNALHSTIEQVTEIQERIK
jgi:hypothetical protein